MQSDGSNTRWTFSRVLCFLSSKSEALAQLLCRGLLVLGSHADLDCDRHLITDNVHTAEDLLELGWRVHEGRAGTLTEDKIDGTAAVEVDCTERGTQSSDCLGCLECEPGLVTRDLSAELHVLAVVVVVDDGLGCVSRRRDLRLVCLQKSPLLLLTLQQRHGHSHLGPRHFCAKSNTKATEGHVTLSRKRSEHGCLCAIVDTALL